MTKQIEIPVTQLEFIRALVRTRGFAYMPVQRELAGACATHKADFVHDSNSILVISLSQSYHQKKAAGSHWLILGRATVSPVPFQVEKPINSHPEQELMRSNLLVDSRASRWKDAVLVMFGSTKTSFFSRSLNTRN
jgi:hypothetical protein